MVRFKGRLFRACMLSLVGMDDEQLRSLRSHALVPRGILPPFELQMQLLGAEFCATLSRNVMEMPCYSSSGKVVQDASSVLVRPLQEDLSAHYGSSAERRGAAKPLGPCYRSKKAAIHGYHDGRAAHMWRLSRVHRRWCPRCGVWLAFGKTVRRVPTADHLCTKILASEQSVSPHVRTGSSSFVGACARCFQSSVSSLKGTPCAPLQLHGQSAESDGCSLSHRMTHKDGADFLVRQLRQCLSVARIKSCRRKRRRGRGTASLLSGVDSSSSTPAVNIHTVTSVKTRKAALQAVPTGSLRFAQARRKVEKKVPQPEGVEPVRPPAQKDIVKITTATMRPPKSSTAGKKPMAPSAAGSKMMDAMSRLGF